MVEWRIGNQRGEEYDVTLLAFTPQRQSTNQQVLIVPINVSLNNLTGEGGNHGRNPFPPVVQG
jgi:hypothetical protein